MGEGEEKGEKVTPAEKCAELWNKLLSPEPYTPDQLRDFRMNLHALVIKHPNNAHLLSARLSIAQLEATAKLDDSIRRFDSASSELIKTTNRLTTRIQWLTVVAVALAVVSVGAALVQLFR